MWKTGRGPLGAPPRTRSKPALLSVQGDPSAFTPVFSDQLHQPRRITSAARNSLQQARRGAPPSSCFLINSLQRKKKKKKSRGKQVKVSAEDAGVRVWVCQSCSSGSERGEIRCFDPGDGRGQHTGRQGAFLLS